MSDYLKITCKHGKGIAAVVCSHLIHSTSPQGFIENSSTPEDLQGWCYQCEAMFLQEGEMTDKFKTFSNAKLVCEVCYQEIKSANII